ncbi:MAG: hypothetical protein ACK53W_17760 [Gemmatimonadota bacterium]
MTSWLLALAAGLGLAALGYAGRGAFSARRRIPAALRGLAGVLLVALWLDAPMGPSRPGTRLLALDASASLDRGGVGDRWSRARAVAESVGGRAVLVGEQATDGPVPNRPALPASRIGPLVERARAEGRSVDLVTDGELDDADQLARLPRESRVFVVEGDARPDLALASLDVPLTTIVGDTITVQAAVVAGAGGAPEATLRLGVDGQSAFSATVPPLDPWAERVVTWRLPAPAAGLRLVGVWREGTPDDEPRNDTLRTALEVLARPTALVVSTAPDADARWIDAGVRGALGTGVRTWWRVAPGEWRESPSLSPVAEADVRRTVAEAGLVVLHGDTAFFGPPATTLRGARWLVAPPAVEGEWYVAPPATGAGSPLGDVLGGASRDSLPPLVAAAAPALEWTALVAQRDKRGTAVPVLTGRDRAPRTAVLSAGGLSRWGLRGGDAATAAASLAGAVAAWLAEAAPDARAVVPAVGAVREGERVTWRRAGRDSLVVLRWSREGEAGAARGTDTLRAAGAATMLLGGAWPAGRYRVEVPGGAVAVVVNPSREWVPRRPTVASGPVGTAAAAASAPTARGALWLVALAIAALCAEWILRRRAGLR